MAARRSFATAISLALLAGTGAVGCASSDSGVRAVGPDEAGQSSATPAPAATAAYLSQVADASKAELPGTSTVTMSISAGALGSSSSTITSTYDAASGRSRISMDMSGLFDSLKGLGGNGTSKDELDSAFSSMSEPTEVITDGTTVYLKSSGFLGMIVGSDTPWVKITAPDGSTAGGDDLLGSNADMGTHLLDSLRGAGADVTEVGPEQLDGVTTTHYRATIDIEAAADKVPADQRDMFRKAMNGIGLSATPVDLWIDGQDHLRKFEGTFSAAAAGSMTISATFGGYGEAQTIDLPPADQVSELDPSTMFGGFGGTNPFEGRDPKGTRPGAESPTTTVN
jgi:hypothetical protein